MLPSGDHRPFLFALRARGARDGTRRERARRAERVMLPLLMPMPRVPAHRLLPLIAAVYRRLSADTSAIVLLTRAALRVIFAITAVVPPSATLSG